MTPRVEEIKQALRNCRAIWEVDEVVRSVKTEVAAMELDPALATMAIQIKNLAAYRRMCIRNGWVPQGHAVPFALGTGAQVQSNEDLR